MARQLTDRAKVDAVTQRLREMFEALESRPIPDRLMSVIDQLDDDDAAPVTPPRIASRHARAG